VTRGSSPTLRAGTVDVAVAATLLTLGVLYGLQAVLEGLGSLGDTGAGLFPLVVAIVLVTASAVVVWQERSKPATSATDDEDAQHGEVDWWRIGAVLTASLAVPIVGNEIGFVVTLSAAVVAISKFMGLPGWGKPILLGIGFGAATWLIFIYWLFVPLPAGRLGLV
jgi:hypothetical protein